MNKNVILISLWILFAIVVRLVPHPPNFTPMVALALFSAHTIKRKWLTYLIPLSAVVISDIVLGFYWINLWVYLGFALVTLIGQFNKLKPTTILASSTTFFIVTNLGVFLSGGYGYTLSGLIACYVMAIPFFINMLVGDFFFSYIWKYSYKFTTDRLINA